MRFDDSLHPPLAILAKIVPLFPIIRRLTMKTTVAFLICLIVVVVRGQGQFHCDVKAPCGCSPSRPTTILSRIIGGEDAQKDAWPWMVSIRDGSGDFCGGTVLNSQWILTATHCFFPNPSIAGLKIVAGSLFIPTKSNNIQIRSVARIISHPHYGDRTSRNDITLLLLRAPLNLTGNSVRPICLPPAGRLLPEDNATMVAIGWGTNSTKHLMYPSNLQQVTVRSINRRMFGCPSIIYYPRQHFCAGLPKGGKDTCAGDSGGPLMSFRNDRWYVDGITSYGDGCALAGHPGVYIRVNFYTPWIQATLKNYSEEATAKTTTTS